VRELLQMPAAMTEDLFQLTGEEVAELRAGILGPSGEASDPRRAWLTRQQLAELFPDDKPGS
jgi:hypothetical protein